MQHLVSFSILSILAGVSHAANGGSAKNAPVAYAASESAPVLKTQDNDHFPRAVMYEYTGMGASESTIQFLRNGSIAYSPAITPAGVGYAISNDHGQTWSQRLPGGPGQPRAQPVLTSADGRWFYWSSSIPGLYFEYSDDEGQSWSAPLDNSHFDPQIQDWAKLISGKAVFSHLSNGASEVLYLSAPSLISTPVPIQPLGPVSQLLLKSTDRGSTWTPTKGRPSLQPLSSGGACEGLANNLAGQELIIWGSGVTTQNGTLVFGLRHCQKLAVAISHDEGDTWKIVDVPGSNLVPFFPGLLTYLFNGNALVADPISRDSAGNLYATWVDSRYVLSLSQSTDGGNSWSVPIVVGAPDRGVLGSVMAFHPKIVHHPSRPGRAALAYYGSADGGKTWNGYIAETLDINASNPIFSSVIANDLSQPLQQNKIPAWDQGYGDPFFDLIEFLDVKYVPGSTDVMAAFTRRMCTAPSTLPEFYDRSSCAMGWDYDAQGRSAWQGLVTTVRY